MTNASRKSLELLIICIIGLILGIGGLLLTRQAEYLSAPLLLIGIYLLISKDPVVKGQVLSGATKYIYSSIFLFLAVLLYIFIA